MKHIKYFRWAAGEYGEARYSKVHHGEPETNRALCGIQIPTSADGDIEGIAHCKKCLDKHWELFKAGEIDNGVVIV